MNPDSVPAVLSALGGIIVSVGLGAKWVINKFQEHIAMAAKKEEIARGELSDRLLREIDNLSEQVKEYKTLLKDSMARENRYMHRVMALEHYITQTPGMHLPQTQGWPPSDR